MRRKKLSEMSYYQRIHHSLAGKTFRVLILFYLILNDTALIFGNYLYYSSVRRAAGMS